MDDAFAVFAKGAREDTLRHRPDRARLASFNPAALYPENRVDLLLLGNTFEVFAFELDELREHTWNPMAANPGRAFYELTAGKPRGSRLTANRQR
jgi:hypothetical protein